MAAPRVVNARPTRSKGESETRTRILKDNTIESIAELINNGSGNNSNFSWHNPSLEIFFPCITGYGSLLNPHNMDSN